MHEYKYHYKRIQTEIKDKHPFMSKHVYIVVLSDRLLLLNES